MRYDRGVGQPPPTHNERKAVKKGEKFSDETVRHIKERLLIGDHPKVLARMLGCTPGTIYRIRDGEMYKHVRVLGEEALWPKLIEVEVAETKGEIIGRHIDRVLPEISDAEMREHEDALERVMKTGRYAERAKTPEELAVEARAKAMLGLD